MAEVRIRGPDWVKTWASQVIEARQVFGFDETASSPILVAGVPLTSSEYASVVGEWWKDHALPIARGVFTGRESRDREDEVAAQFPEVATAQDVLDSMFKVQVRLVKAASSSRRSLDGDIMMDGNDAVVLWTALRKVAVSMGSLGAAVTADERWKAFSSGARAGAESVKDTVVEAANGIGQAVGEVAAVAGRAAGAGIGGVLEGSGLDNVLLVGGAVVAARFAGVI